MSESCRAQGLGDTGSPEDLSQGVAVGVTSGGGRDATDSLQVQVNWASCV